MASTQLRTEIPLARERFLPVLLEILSERLGSRLVPEQFDADLTELGVDSLMAIEISHRLEEELSIVIDDREVLGFRSVNAICATLQRCSTSATSGAPGVDP